MKGKEKRKTISGITYLFGLIIEIEPKRIVLMFLRNFLDYFERILYGIYFFKLIFICIERKARFNNICFIIMIALVLILLVDIYNKWYDLYYVPVSNCKIKEKLNFKIFDKAADVDLEYFENVDFFNSYMQSNDEINNKVIESLQDITKFFVAILASFYVVIYIGMINIGNVIFVACPIIGILIIAKKVNRIYYDRYINNLPNYRMLDYVNRVMSEENYSKEIKLTNIYQVLKGIYKSSYYSIRDVINKFAFKSILLNSAQSILVFVAFSDGLLAFNSYNTIVKQHLSFSEFIVLANAIGSLAWIMVEALNYAGNIARSSLCGNNLREFFEIKNKIVDCKNHVSPSKKFNMLSFEHVYFKYHGAQEPTLRDIHLSIHSGEKIAIVGENGSGKSTLVKLILRLYDAQEGKILYNNRPINQYKLSEYRDLFSTAFQDYQMYALTIAENLLNREAKTKEDYLIVERALALAQMNEYILSLSKKYDSVLTKEFTEEGEVLSKGQMQKLAVARAYSKDFEIGIFDEPSSALDPIAESEMYKIMMNNCRNKTLILVSHRLSTIVDVDRIYMMNNGHIVESGNHSELMKLNGLYAKMYREQAKHYQYNFEG